MGILPVIGTFQTATKENALRRFERKVLRKIYGPVVDKEVWRIRCNKELCKLMGGEDMVSPFL